MPQGATGSQGPTGSRGAVGTTGARGSQGSSGAQGFSGNVGGPQGSSGTSGVTGPTGPQGLAFAVSVTGNLSTSGSVVATDVVIPATKSLSDLVNHQVPTTAGAPLLSGYLFPLSVNNPWVASRTTYTYDPQNVTVDTFADTLLSSSPYWAQLNLSATGYVSAYSITCGDPSRAPTSWFVEYLDASGFPYLWDIRTNVTWTVANQTQYFVVPEKLVTAVVINLTSTTPSTVKLSAVGVYGRSSYSSKLYSDQSSLASALSSLPANFSETLYTSNPEDVVRSTAYTTTPYGYATSYSFQCGDPRAAPSSWTVTAYGANVYGIVLPKGTVQDTQSGVTWSYYGQTRSFPLPASFYCLQLDFSFSTASTLNSVSVFTDHKTAVARLDQKLTTASTLLSGYSEALVSTVLAQQSAASTSSTAVSAGLSTVSTLVSGLATSVSGLAPKLSTLAAQVVTYVGNSTFKLPASNSWAASLPFTLPSPDRNTWNLVQSASPPLPFWDALSLSITGVPTYYTVTCGNPSKAPTQWSVLVYDQKGAAPSLLTSVSGAVWTAQNQTQTFTIPDPVPTVDSISLAWTSATPSTIQLVDVSFYSTCADSQTLLTKLASSVSLPQTPTTYDAQLLLQTNGALVSGSIVCAEAAVGPARMTSAAVTSTEFSTPSGFLVSGSSVGATSFATPSGFLVSGGSVRAPSYANPSGLLVSGASFAAPSFSTPSGFSVSGGSVGATSFSTPSGFLVSGGCVGATSFSALSGVLVSGGSLRAASFSTASGFSVSGGTTAVSNVGVNNVTVNSSFQFQQPFLQVFTSGFSVTNNQAAAVNFTTTEVSSPGTSGYLSTSGAYVVNTYGSPIVARVSYTLSWEATTSGYFSAYIYDSLNRRYAQTGGFSNPNGLLRSGTTSLYLSGSGYFRLYVSAQNASQGSVQATGIRMTASVV